MKRSRRAPPSPHRRARTRPNRLLLALLLVLLGTAPQRGEPDGAGTVRVLDVDGVVNPMSARYLVRGVREAADAGAEAVVVRLDTPGGLESSMREMVRAMLNAEIPVIVYVAPSGARAASAGMFITIAGHVAAMAPGTNIGAAHPVGVGGDAPDTVMSEKVVNDAAALARAVARDRGRNADWAERAVRESVSITADEALDANVIDLVADDLSGLLRRIDGQQVTTGAGETTLNTASARIVERSMTLPERVLQTVTDPNIAYILFTIGIIGIIAELYNPGMLFPGITGAISLILAFTAFGSLPINWAGVLLLVLALALFIAELYAEGTGILAVGGLIAFIIGSLIFYRPIGPVSPSAPDARVSPWVIGATTTVFVGFFVIVLRALVRSHQEPVATGMDALIGRDGVAETDLSPMGRVQIDGESWSAMAERGTIPAGRRVRVVAVRGVTLRVEEVG